MPDLTDRDGEPLRGEEDDDIRPMVTGLYTYLPADPTHPVQKIRKILFELRKDLPMERSRCNVPQRYRFYCK